MLSLGSEDSEVENGGVGAGWCQWCHTTVTGDDAMPRTMPRLSTTQLAMPKWEPMPALVMALTHLSVLGTLHVFTFILSKPGNHGNRAEQHYFYMSITCQCGCIEIRNQHV